MKTIYNTLTTTRDVQEFLNDGGRIFVSYYKMNKTSDLYDVANIMEIKCEFTVNYSMIVKTYMNKFFRFSLFQVAMPATVIDAKGQVVIEFRIKNFDDVQKNEFKILSDINDMIKNALFEVERLEKEMEICNRRKEISKILSGKKRITNKFIDALRYDETISNMFADEYIYFWYNNDEIRKQIKYYISVTLSAYFYEGTSYDERMKYYVSEYEKYMEYIA